MSGCARHGVPDCPCGRQRGTDRTEEIAQLEREQLLEDLVKQLSADRLARYMTSAAVIALEEQARIVPTVTRRALTLARQLLAEQEDEPAAAYVPGPDGAPS